MGEAAGPARAALGEEEFAALMAPLGPFERNPFLAVAVSGGADSLALCLLAARWAQACGGTVAALTVDHGLRPDSAAEAQKVASWLAPRGIAHHILAWRPAPGLRNVQAAARGARHALLAGWCRSAGCLHLLTAHHRDDQAETLLLRLARGSGLDGLAGMAALRETAECRLLHPLLAVPRERLAATLRAAGQEWVEDPSNADPAYARSRLRRSAALLACEGLGAARLAATARHLGRARAALEIEVARTLARSVALHPAGFARLAPACLAEAAPEIALRALARLIATVGGAAYPPRLERLERLGTALMSGLKSGRTLGACRFVPWRGGVLVCREPVSVAPPRALVASAEVRWDGRFAARLSRESAADRALSIGAMGASLGDTGLAEAAARVPGAVRPTLPALRDLVGIVAVPHLQYVRRGSEGALDDLALLTFRPELSLTAPGFTVV